MAKKKAAEPEIPDDLEQLLDWANEAETTCANSRELSEKCRDYYDSKQLSTAEVNALKKRKQAPVVVNRVKPKMDGLMGMERSNKTTAKAYGRTPKHDKAANAASEGIRYCLQTSFYDQQRSASWENMLIEGTGGVDVIAEDKGDRVKITITHIMWDRLLWDPHSRRKDFTDARYLGQVMWMDYDLAVERFPEGANVLESMLESRTATFDDKPRWIDSKRRRVKIVELYYLEDDGDWHYACFTRGGFLNEPRVSPYRTETGETEHPYEFGSLFVDRDGNRYGAMLQLLDVQDEINKRRSKALHLMSVRQVRWERGAVEDINAARQELAKPDGVIETTPGMEFEVLKTNDMAQAQFKLLEDAKLEIDSVSYNAAAAGKDQRLMSGIALRNREAAAQTELAPMFDQLKHMDVRVYRKVWNRIKQYWRSEMWIRITDNPEDLKWVGLNAPMTRGQEVMLQAKEQGLPPEKLQAVEMQIQQDPSMQEQVMHNDVAELDVDIIIDDAPDSVTMQQEEFQALSEMVKSGIPIPPTAIVASSNLKDKDKIIQEMKLAPQLPPEVQDQMKKLKEENQLLQQENQKMQADHSVDFAKLNMQHDHKMQEMAMGTEGNNAEIANERARMEAEFALKKEMQDKQIQLDRERAEADAAIKLMTAQNDAHVREVEMQNDTQLREKEMQTQTAQADQKLAAETSQAEKKIAGEQKNRERETTHKIEMDRATQEAKDKPMTAALDKLMSKIGELVDDVQDIKDRVFATVTKVEPIRGSGGDLRGVRVEKSDGSVQEINASLH